MTILTRYISKEILKTTFAITTVVVLVMGSGRFTYYLSKAVAGDLSAPAVLEIMANLLPVLLSSILPLSVFMGVLIALGRLGSDNEMVVLFANGISLNRLLAMVAMPVALLATVVLLLSTMVAPYGARVVEEVLYVEYRTSEFEHIVPGKFHTNNDQQVIYAQSISANQTELLNVFVFNQVDAHTSVIVRADKARQAYQAAFGAKYLLLENGTRTEVTLGHDDTVVTEFAEMGMLISNTQIDANITRSDTLSTWSLLGSDVSAHNAQLYWRFSLPLMTMVMAAMAVALSQVKPRQGRFSRIVPALVLFLSYLYLLIFFRDQLAAGVPLSAAKMGFVHVAYALLSVWFLYGKQWWQNASMKAANNQQAEPV